MLLIDNYDSFTYNIVQYLRMLGERPQVIKNDEMPPDAIDRLRFQKIIISPGWGSPENSGVSMEVIRRYQDKASILGICLGMQCLAAFFGARIVRAPVPCHGKNSDIFFRKGFELFKDFPQGFSATRYHSLMISNPTPDTEIMAETADHIPMALRIRNKRLYGVQFHPEAVLTEHGIDIFRNFISLC